MSIQQIECSADASYLPAGLKYLTVHSSALKGRGNISCYNAGSTQQHLPIVILLHGVYGNHWVWMNLGRVHEVYEELRRNGEIGEMLLVMPEDGSYYAGSGYLPLTEGRDFDTWIMQDSLEAVIDSIDCVSKNSPIYLTGLSMGGYGALRLGAKHAQRVSGISAHSAITCLEDFRHFINEDLSIYQCANDKESDLLHWCQLNRSKLPPIRIDCGTDDVLFPSNTTLVKKLETAQIEHSFKTPPGGHEWSYWHRQIAETLRFFECIQTTS
ncbi:ATPase [Gilvimarinus agarilyticus]|uniref:alpha/beta hydrolase n=1 Tax=Gilvimarinus sp. 2_MG-2023 TaxID=3062666 RepID=UPI001C095565|nr:alpha/beta hydrolase-fold protein [Gilvimarinus sp. 2_MG-2023]MBU2887680.1 ATPase [Gilvimarinus agarilyticus]MDO6572328.1 alpha/beta hydrolase-fold protein [Gilvimarinus sp. 2_MG-2023]